MVETCHQGGDIDAEGFSLVVAPGFPQTMGSIIALQVNCVLLTSLIRMRIKMNLL